jgi:hypothetical protein
VFAIHNTIISESDTVAKRHLTFVFITLIWSEATFYEVVFVKPHGRWAGVDNAWEQEELEASLS